MPPQLRYTSSLAGLSGITGTFGKNKCIYRTNSKLTAKGITSLYYVRSM